MQEKRHAISSQILLEEIRSLLEDDGVKAVPLGITGSSMTPFLVDGRDTAYLSRLTRPVKRGDVLLYRRENGSVVLHRVFKVEESGCTMVGDGQDFFEPGIRQEQIVAIMTAAQRKGKRIASGSFWWEFFEKIWIRLVPIRRTLRKIYAAFR